MRITSRSTASREAQSESVATSGSVPVRVRSASAARNRKGPAKRSFRGVPVCSIRKIHFQWSKATVRSRLDYLVLLFNGESAR